jgi:hypothetical protein
LSRQANSDPNLVYGSCRPEADIISSISGLDRHMFKIWILLEWSEVDLPHVEFVEQSIFVRAERDTHWDAIAIQIFGFYNTATLRPIFAPCKLKAPHSAIVHVTYLSSLQLAKQLLAARRLSK